MTKSQARNLLGFGIWVLGFGISLAAHHSDAAFDPRQLVTLEGRVTSFAWQNPHIHITLQVSGPRGSTTWDIEGNPPGRIRGRGLKDALKPGDRVRMTVYPAKDGSLAFARGHELTLPDGRRFGIGSAP
jgi:hypothetical protein